MKKLITILAIFTMASALLFASVSYKDALAESADLIYSVASYDTPVAFVSLDSDSEAFASRFIADTEEALMERDCIVLDRQNIEEVKKEMMLQASGLVSNKSAVSIGNMVGAKLIILGSATGNVSSYHLEISVLDVETGAVRRRKSFDLKYDRALENIIAGSSDKIGSQLFSVGVRLGSFIQFNKAHEDMVGTNARPREESPVSFAPTFVAAFNVMDNLKIQGEFSYVPQNGIDVYDYTVKEGDDIYAVDTSVSYGSVELPLLISWNFMRSPVSVDAYAGGYISLPVTAANLDVNYKTINFQTSGAVDMAGITYGVTGGFSVGIETSSGIVIVDGRINYDLTNVKAKVGGVEKGLLYRRSMAFSVGYMFQL